MRLVAMLAAGVLLVGLAPPDVRAEDTESPTNGAVIVRILPNTPGMSWSAFHSWDDVTVQRVVDDPAVEPPRIHLKTATDGTSRSTIYTASLAPGIYRFEELSNRKPCFGIGCVNLRIVIRNGFSHFEVTTGHLTDLGVLIQSDAPDGPFLSFGPSTYPTETRDIIKELLPELDKLTSDAAPSWVPGTVPAKMPELYGWTMNHAVGVVSPRQVADGKFIYGTTIGTVIGWEPGKPWLGHDTGTRSAIESVLVTSSGYWVIGGELGLLRISTDHGHSWQSVRGNLPFGVVVGLNQWHDKIVATTWMRKDVYVHSADIGESDWKELAHYPVDDSRPFDRHGVFPRSVLVDNSLITPVPARKLAHLDLSSGQVEMRVLPGTFGELSFSGDGILRCICGKTIGMGPYDSHDLGKTWRGSSNWRVLSLPVFRNPQYGVAYVRTSPATGKLTSTQNGGALWKWNERWKSLALPISLFYSEDGRVIYASSVYGDFQMSRDDGKSWEPVR